MQRIKMTKELAQEMAREFYNQIVSDTEILGSSYEFKYAFKKKAEKKIQITFTAEAYEKMRALIDNFSGEVGWHGLVNRISETEFEIYDILVYPQRVTGVTVNTDQQAYQEWLMSQPDEIFNAIRMQGHSHVNMSVFASGEDAHDQTRLIQNLMAEDYYIFMIWNKRMECYVRVVDMKTNVSYDTDDVDVFFEGSDMTSFLREANQMVKKTTTSYGSTGYFTGAGAVVANNNALYDYSSRKQSTGVSEKGSGNSGSSNSQKVGGVYFGTSTPQKGKTEKEKKVTSQDVKPAAPDKKYDSLADYYRDHQDDLEEFGNSSCQPYFRDFD